MIVVFTITEINYLMASSLCDLVGPLWYLYLWYYILWLRYLPCFRHNDKRLRYSFLKAIHHILIRAHQAKLFLNIIFRLNSVLQIVWFMVLCYLFFLNLEFYYIAL